MLVAKVWVGRKKQKRTWSREPPVPKHDRQKASGIQMSRKKAKKNTKNKPEMD